MTNDTQAAATMLRRARVGLSPSERDHERVRAALAAALATPAPSPPVARAAAKTSSLAAWTTRLLVTTALAGGVGFWAGYRVGRDAPGERPAPTVTAKPQPLGSVAPPTVRGPSLLASVGEPPARAARTKPRLPAAPRTSAASLEAELRALRAVERALRDHQPGMALALLRELDRDVPDGQLLEEREATAAIARCATGDVPFGVDLARDFRESHPDSVYLGRVAQGCAGK